MHHGQRQLRPGMYRNGKTDDGTQRHLQHLRATLGLLGFGTGKDETQRDRRNRTVLRPREQVTIFEAEEERDASFWKGRVTSGGDIIQGWKCGPVLKYTTVERAGPQISAGESVR